MDEWEQPRGRAEWTHPRRAAKEIISYLSQVEPVIDQYAQDDHSYEGGGGDDEDEDEDVGREQMMDNILEELKHQTASIMEDRQGSVVAEKIVRRLTPLQLRTMLGRCRGYMLSLANNRYSSHVLQTLLSVSGQVVEGEVSEGIDGDDGYDNAADGDTAGGGNSNNSSSKVDLMQDIVLSLVSELSGAWAELLADISGSHVGRGFLQVLGGLPILSEKRGRQSRHAHSIGTAVGTGRMVGGRSGGAKSVRAAIDPEALEKWSTPYKHRVPRSFVAALEEVTSELAALPASELQTLACGTFGCPLLVMLLRVHGNLATKTAAAAAKGGEGYDEQGSVAAGVMVMPCLEQESAAMSIVMKVLEWGDEERSAQVVYAISGENTASHFLEAVLWLSPRKFFEDLYHRCFESKLLEFCEHGVSNFLIQAALQRADDKALAENMVEAISDNASELLKARRAGVLWRAAQACVRLGLKPKTQTKLLGDIARAVQAGHTGAPPPPPGTTSGDDIGSAAAEAAKEGDGQVPSTVDAFKAARSWVPALLSPRLPGEGGLDRLFLNVPGARILQNALLFDPPVAAPVLKAVAALPEDVLAAIARDNMGSRCLLDPILEAAGARGGGGSRGKNKPAEDARRAMLRAFRGHLVAMACDRVAWHILLKCFRGVDMKEKRAIAEELAGGGEQAWSRMSGYPSGRSVLTECMVERFSRSPHEWEEAFKNRDNRAKMLTEILAVESSSKKPNGKADGGQGGGKSDAAGRIINGVKEAGLAPSPFNTQAGDREDAGKGKEKRRRQRGRGKRGKSSAIAGEELAPDADAGGEGGGAAAAAADNDRGGDVAESGGKATTTRGEKGSKKTQKGEVSEAENEGAVDDDAATSKKKRGRAGKDGPTEENGGGGDGRGGATAVADISKKKKRKRQEDRSKTEGVDAGGAATVVGEEAAGDSRSEGKDVDASVDTKQSSESGTEGQAPSTTVAKKKNKKKKKAKGGSGDDSGVGGDGKGGGTTVLSETAAAEKAPTAVAGDEDEAVGVIEGKKKKKKTKRPKESTPALQDSMWNAVETPAKKRKGDKTAVVDGPKAAGGSGKKRKGGFRLF